MRFFTIGIQSSKIPMVFICPNHIFYCVSKILPNLLLSKTTKEIGNVSVDIVSFTFMIAIPQTT
jgi:hypothetical protein